MKKEYQKVVLDGANIIHDDTGVEKYDDEGNRIIQILPERLEAAITHCEDLGWPTIACLKKGTYMWAAANPKSPNVGDISIIDGLISEGKVELIHRKKEDIYWIDYALKENAWIVTHDGFKDVKKPDGTTKKGERTLYPDRDWEDIEQRTLREHTFVNDKFILPGLPKKKASKQKSDEFVTQNQFNQLEQQLKVLQKMVRNMAHSEVKKKAINPSPEKKNQTNREIMEAVMSQSLSNGKRVEIGHFHRLIGSAVLGLDIEKYPQEWSKGWNENFKEKLGFEGKFYDWLKKNSIKPISIAEKEGKKGTSEVFYS